MNEIRLKAVRFNPTKELALIFLKDYVLFS